MITGPAETPGTEEWDMVRGPGRGLGCAVEMRPVSCWENIQRKDVPEKMQNNERTCGWAPRSQHLGNSLLRIPRPSLLHVSDKAGVGVAESPVQPPLWPRSPSQAEAAQQGLGARHQGWVCARTASWTGAPGQSHSKWPRLVTGGTHCDQSPHLSPSDNRIFTMFQGERF